MSAQPAPTMPYYGMPMMMMTPQGVPMQMPMQQMPMQQMPMQMPMQMPGSAVPSVHSVVMAPAPPAPGECCQCVVTFNDDQIVDVQAQLETQSGFADVQKLHAVQAPRDTSTRTSPTWARCRRSRRHGTSKMRCFFTSCTPCTAQNRARMASLDSPTSAPR